MSLSDALILSLVGFCVVIFALGLIALFIIVMAKVVAKMQGKKAPVAAPAPVAVAVAVAVAAPSNKVAIPATTSMGSCDLHNVSDRDAALIMAIVADKLDAPLNTLVFKSIREV